MEDSDRLLWHNGQLTPVSSPTIAVGDQAIVLGQGIFETLIAYRGGKPFQMQEHYDRLLRGAEAMGLQIPSCEELIAAIRLTTETNHLTERENLRIRITVTGGTSNLRFQNAKGSEQVFIEVGPAPPVRGPAKTISVPFARNEKGALAGLKTINYGENVVALLKAREAGADEAIFGNTEGNLCEGTWSNVFVRIDGRWITPPLSSGCLPGVTRGLVIELLEEAEMPIEEIDLAMDRLGDVDGAFFTSTLRGVQPIVTLDGRNLPTENHTSFQTIAGIFRDFTLR